MKYILPVVIFVVLSFLIVFPAEAAFCRSLNDHVICVLSIQRSAKYYWEYRAAVSVDGVTYPIEVYNCRDRIKTKLDGATVSFEPNGAGELICGMFKK